MSCSNSTNDNNKDQQVMKNQKCTTQIKTWKYTTVKLVQNFYQAIGCFNL